MSVVSVIVLSVVTDESVDSPACCCTCESFSRVRDHDGDHDGGDGIDISVSDISAGKFAFV